jgi:hypothetical protein
MRNFVRNTLIVGGALAAILTTGAAAQADVVHPAIAPHVAPAVAPAIAPAVAPDIHPNVNFHPADLGR